MRERLSKIMRDDTLEFEEAARVNSCLHRLEADGSIRSVADGPKRKTWVNMHSTYTVSALALVGIFAAGCALGWIISLIRGFNFAGVRLAAKLLSSADRSVQLPAVPSTTQLYELNCKCGEVLKFRGPRDTGTSGLPPLPDDDFYSCPMCGAAINLRQIRERIASLEQSRR